MENKKEVQVTEEQLTPETTKDIEVVIRLARGAIAPYTSWQGRIDEVRASGWYNYDRNED